MVTSPPSRPMFSSGVTLYLHHVINPTAAHPAPGAAARCPFLAVVQLRRASPSEWGSRVCTHPPAPPCARPITGRPPQPGWCFGLRARVCFEGYELYGVAHTMRNLKNYGRGTPAGLARTRLYSAYPHFGS